MRRVNRLQPLRRGGKLRAENVTEAIATVAHRQEFEGVLRSHIAPAAGHCLGGGAGGESTLEFVRHDQNSERHAVLSGDPWKRARRDNRVRKMQDKYPPSPRPSSPGRG